MADRRSRRKLETRGKILKSATALFNRQGFAPTTMEQVAEDADVGVGTLYNYFRSKDQLLLGVFTRATEELLEDGRRVVAAPGDDPVEAVCRLLAVYQRLARLFDKPVMREMLAATLVQPAAAVEDYASLDLQLAASVGELLGSLKARGRVSADVDVGAASIALYGALILPFLLFVSLAEMNEAALDAMVRQQVEIIFSGLLPREGEAS